MQATRAEGCKQPFAARTHKVAYPLGNETAQSDVCSFLSLAAWLTRHAPDLRGAPRVVYQALSQLHNAGNCCPSKAELQLLTNTSPNTLSDALAVLQAQHFVELDVGAGRGGRNVYRLMRGPWGQAVDPAAPNLDPPQVLGGGAPPRYCPPLKGSENQLKEQGAAPPRVPSTEQEELAAARAEMALSLAALDTAPIVTDNPARPSVDLPAVARGSGPPVQPSHRPSSPRGISSTRAPLIARSTHDALCKKYGVKATTDLGRKFCESRWRAPGAAEAACRILLCRSARNPWAYVDQLYPSAIAAAGEALEALAREAPLRAGAG